MANALSAAGFALVLLGCVLSVAFPAGGVAVAAVVLMAAGLALFVLTLLVNAVASVVVARSRSGASTEI